MRVESIYAQTRLYRAKFELENVVYREEMDCTYKLRNVYWREEGCEVCKWEVMYMI